MNTPAIDPGRHCAVSTVTAVDAMFFSVNGAAYYALVPGLRYRVYYLPSDHKLVSIEPLL